MVSVEIDSLLAMSNASSSRPSSPAEFAGLSGSDWDYPARPILVQCRHCLPDYPGAMHQTDRVRLHFGPYRTPRFKVGQEVQCAIRGKVAITGVSKGRIPWPYCRPRTRLALVVYGDLETAVRRESAAAVAHWWGVAWTTVRRWRRALGVGRYNAGTVKLRKAGYKDAKRSEKISATKTGRARPPLTAEWKEKIRASLKRYHRT